MRLILSNPTETSHIPIIDYFHINNLDYWLETTIDEDSFPDLFLKITSSGIEFNIGGHLISSIWLRKYPLYSLNSKNKTIENFIQNEYNTFFEYLAHNELKYWKSLGSSQRSVNELNKLRMLRECLNFEVNIPNTYIINSRKKLLELIERYPNSSFISKPISNVINVNKKKHYFKMLTSKLTNKEVNKLPEKFPISMIQEYINKKFDIRCFYINKKIYSGAIFSQTQEATKIDFRNYTEIENRYMAFKLPQSEIKKIIALLRALKINIATFDILFDGSIYYLIDLNPYGQYTDLISNLSFDINSEIINFLE